MTDSRQPDPTASNIAKQMRTKGMNTVQIMRTLFEAANSLSLVAGNASALNQAIATDVTAATLQHDLETKVDASIRHLGALVNNTKGNIDSLRTVKTSGAVADTFQNDLKSLEVKVTEFEIKHKEYIGATKKFITTMREAFAQLAKDPNNRDAKKKVSELYAELQVKAEETRKYLMGDNVKVLTSQISALHNTVAQAAASATGKPSQQIPQAGQH